MAKTPEQRGKALERLVGKMVAGRIAADSRYSKTAAEYLKSDKTGDSKN